MQSCDILVRGKKNYPNLYNFVIKTVIEFYSISEHYFKKLKG